MKLDSSPGFNRDLRRVRDAALRRRIHHRIAELEMASTLSEVSGIHRVSSARGIHYRIRIGNYRLGITIEDDVVVLRRFLHRGEFYSHFP